MNGTLFENIGIDSSYLIIAMFIIIVILIGFIIALFKKQKALEKKYNTFLNGKTGLDLEQIILTRFAEMDKIKSDNRKIIKEQKNMKDELKTTFSKVGLLKYDAFKEMGGTLSFAFALLTEENNGIIINCMHAREGCFTYAKEIINGESYIQLSEEEKEVLKQAINAKDVLAELKDE